MRPGHQGRAHSGGGRTRRPRRASRDVRWIVGRAEAWGSGKLVPLGEKLIAKSFEPQSECENVQTWTIAVVSRERLERRFSAKLTEESENHAGFLAGVAVVSTV